MKRNFTFVLSLCLVFCFCYWVGKSFPLFWDEPQVSTTSIVRANNDALYHAAIWRQFDEPANSEDLFDFLYTVGLDNYFKDRSLRQAVATHFNRPYPIDSDPHHMALQNTEIVGRLGILKILSARFTPKNFNENPTLLVDLYREILNNTKENWIVKRQALQALSPWMHYLTSQEREEILATQDARTIRSAAKSEIEIIREASQNVY